MLKERSIEIEKRVDMKDPRIFGGILVASVALEVGKSILNRFSDKGAEAVEVKGREKPSFIWRALDNYQGFKELADVVNQDDFLENCRLLEALAEAVDDEEIKDAIKVGLEQYKREWNRQAKEEAENRQKIEKTVGLLAKLLSK